jgi:hypothetical protein
MVRSFKEIHIYKSKFVRNVYSEVKWNAYILTAQKILKINRILKTNICNSIPKSLSQSVIICFK